MFTHRERVLLALNHEQPDRVPMDLGGTQTSILVEPYSNLKHYLGLHTPTSVNNIVLGLAKVEDSLLERFDIDFLHVLPRMPDTWKYELLPDDSFYDDWGVRWQRPAGGFYYDMVEHPLAGADAGRLENFAWPDPQNAGRVLGVAYELKSLRDKTEFALEAGLVGLWECSWFLVGLENWLVVLKADPDFAATVMDHVLEILMRMHGAYLDEAGPYLDIVTLWDDYGAQSSTLISPSMWRKLVKPRLAKLVSSLKLKTQAKIGLHSCGSLGAILDDIVEVGIEVLNPVQVSAGGMDPTFLKKRYGRRITFWGGIDTHKLLPNGTPAEVARTTRETIDILGTGGGYILAAVHNIQPGVPPENIVAMYDTARAYHPSSTRVEG